MEKQKEGESNQDVFPAGSLWDRIRAVTEQALQSGAVQPIKTEPRYCLDRGIQFLIRVVSRLREKPSVDDDHNPFSPCEAALYVGDALDSHVCVLNKYNVVEHHLLIVTRDFQHQETQLFRDDFHAWWRCMREYDSLGFYNSGTLAGASQPHKHMQLVPLPMHQQTDHPGRTIPARFDAVASPRGRIVQLDELPFRHAFVRRDTDDAEDPEQVAEDMHVLYHDMMRFMGIRPPTSADALISTPYNLLVSPHWMFLIPRAAECFQEISLNSLAFLGAFLVQDKTQLEHLLDAGPFTALESVTFPRA